MSTLPPVIITHYTEEEGGQWFPWPETKPKHMPANIYLNSKRDTYFYRREFNGKLVDFRNVELHAFKTNTGRIWDVVNGWRDGNNAE